ncbi:MAG: ATP synthase F1 subunit gamma [Defluviitaleaceae bacterium]|nr:ATP synthase F1 subunit gamma [Defluviitaleaceae bacterium]
MATMRDIKGRIRSVTTTKKTTKAMNLVSSAKMARARGRLHAANPYFTLTRKAISDILNSGPAGLASLTDNPIFEDETKVAKKSLIVIISNDRGLCGGYNANISKMAAALALELSNEGKEVSFFTIGNKGREYFKRAGAVIIDGYTGISEGPSLEDSKEITQKLINLYLSGEFDEVYIAYTQFVSAISYNPKTLRLLPLNPSDFVESEGDDKAQGHTIKFEPSPKEVLSYIIPKYLGTAVYETLITSAASGQGATMTAMDSATENAEKIIGNLTLVLNRVRQAAITQEIAEIVGGANALK